MITLVRRTLPARTKLTGEQGDLVVAAGQTLVIETSPGGVEVLSAECPAGKTWRVSISVSIDEV